MSSPRRSFAIPDHGSAPNDPPSPVSPGGGSSPGGRSGKLPFSWGRTRSRETSPAAEERSSSPAGPRGSTSRSTSPSFVVRSVQKQPGGVSLDPGSGGAGEQPRRMTLEDGDHQNGYAPRPSMSLNVPPGGPGGGTGYGVAGSSNDGRDYPSSPAAFAAAGRGRPPSPGAITAGGFQQGVRDRQHGLNSPRISPGPLSLAQQQREREQQQQWQQQHQSGRSPGTSPTGAYIGSSPKQSSPLAQPALSPINTHATGSSQFRNGRPSAGPLDGMPSPVEIPQQRGSRSRSHSRDGRDADARTPFGSVSPGPSPGTSPAQRGRSPASPGFASRFMKGIFGRSPKLADRADDMYNGDDQWRRDGLGPVNGEGATPYGIPGDAWSDGSPLPGRSPVTGQSSFGRGSRDQREGLREDDRAAQLQKRDSLLQAQRIVDAERRAAMDSAGRPRAAFDPDNDVPWSPRQVVESGDEEEGPDGWGGLKEGRVPDHRQTRSPPGRKPVPTLETLQKMPEAQRVKVAEEVDPDDALSKLEGRLTPAQRIIQETRSKHLEREKLQAQARAAREAAEASKKQSGSGLATSPRKETQIQRGFEPQPPDTPPKDPARLPPSQPQAQNEIASKPPPPRQQPEVRPPAAQAQGQTAAVPNSPGVAPSHPHVAPKSPAAPAPAGPSPRPAGGAGSGLSPGNGPMPLDMKLPHALQEMMVRFYRFERYSVPLIRSLETRILDIERDSQMAQHGDAMSANSARDREMDKWVGQMTSVMRHEIGQLRAATKEIREGRELIAAIAKQGGPGTRTREPTAADSPSSIRADPGTGTVAGPRGSAAPSPLSQDKGKGRQLDEGSDALSELSASKTRGGPDHAQRKTNISSASFNSAVPRTPKSVHSRTNTLDLPAGAAPALDRDEGKYGRRDVERAPSHGRERSTSPSGRKRYTAALGEAMQDGRISPSARRGEGSVSVSGDESALSTPAPAGERFESPHPPPSPAPSDTHSTTSSIRKRDQSVEDRLRALVGRHASPSQTSMSTSIDEIEELRTDSPEQLRPSTKIGDDYGDTPRGKVAGARANTAPAPAPAPTGHLEAPSPSRTSTLASAHLKAPSATSAISAASGASSATYSPSRNRPGSGWRGTSPGAHSPTPSARSVSPSPSNFVPAATGSSITTHSRASQGLRARAQTYLQNSEKTGGQGATPILAPAPPPRTSTGGGLPARSPSPGAWMSGRAGTSPGAIGSGSSVGPGSWTRRSTSPSPVPSPLPGGPIDGLPSSSRGMDAPTSHLRLSTSPNKMGLRSTSPEPSSSAPIAPLNFERKATAPSSAVAHGPLSPLSPGTPSTPGTPKRTGPASGANLAERIAFFDANK